MHEGAHPRRVAVLGAIGFASIVIAMWTYWPAGVGLGLVLGIVATAVAGRFLQAEAEREPHDGELDLAGPSTDDLWQDFRRLRVRLGDDWRDFSAAAMLVTRSQWASASGLQRDLGVSALRARQLLDLLEAEGFVGPVNGTRPRAVLVAPEAWPQLERLLHA